MSSIFQNIIGSFGGTVNGWLKKRWAQGFPVHHLVYKMDEDDPIPLLRSKISYKYLVNQAIVAWVSKRCKIGNERNEMEGYRMFKLRHTLGYLLFRSSGKVQEMAFHESTKVFRFPMCNWDFYRSHKNYLFLMAVSIFNQIINIYQEGLMYPEKENRWLGHGFFKFT